MFELAEMRDVVRVPPNKFNLPLEQAIIEELNRKLANMIVLNVGLCICVFDLIKMEDSYIFPGDGASHTRTSFQMVVFKPSNEEILEGVVKAASPLGIQVSIDFYDGIIIKAENMMGGSYYDETEKVWIWNYEDNKLFIDVGQKIRFKVVSSKFVDTTPSGPELAAEFHAANLNSRQPNTGISPAVTSSKDPIGDVHPYTVYGSIELPGLGVLDWWDDDEGGAEEAAGNGEEEEEN